MFRMIVQLAASARAVLQHAPTNRLLRRLQLRRGLVSAVAAMLTGVAYLFAAVFCTVLLDRGGPGWLNILVLLFLYNSGKLVLHGLAILIAPTWERLGRRRSSRLAGSSTGEAGGGPAHPRQRVGPAR
jgi:hypothetical protein